MTVEILLGIQQKIHFWLHVITSYSIHYTKLYEGGKIEVESEEGKYTRFSFEVDVLV